MNNRGLNSSYIILQQFIEMHREQAYQSDWVMVVMIAKSGSSYRNPGAFMLVGPHGERLGVMSGGCLEQDIVKQAFFTHPRNTTVLPLRK